MKQYQIKARVPADPKVPGSVDKSAVVNVNYPDMEGDIDKAYEEAAQAFGKKAVLSNAFANWRVTLQSGLRKGIENGEAADALQARFGAAKMGAATVGGSVDAEAAFTAKFLSATPAEREAMISKLKASASKK